MELELLILGGFIVYLLACWMMARQRKCTTLHVILQTLAIQGAGRPGGER